MLARIKNLFVVGAIVAACSGAGQAAALDAIDGTDTAFPSPYQLDAKISVYLGGLEILKFDWETVQMHGNYRSSSHVYPVGVAAMLFDVDVRSKAAGIISQNRTQPTFFESSYLEDGEEARFIRIGFDAAGPAELTRVNGDDTISDEDILKMVDGMIDPLSAAMFNQTFVTDGEICGGGKRIFSGDSAYTLNFKFVKETVLKKSRYSDYEGPAYLCEVSGEPIAAFDEGARERLEARSSDEKPSLLYIGRLRSPVAGGADLLVPVKVKVPTSFGTAVAHLTHHKVTNPAPREVAEK